MYLLYSLNTNLTVKNWNSIWCVYYSDCSTWVRTSQVSWKYHIVASYCQLTKRVFFNSVAFPLLSLVFLEENRHLIFGSTDGQVSDAPLNSSNSLSETEVLYISNLYLSGLGVVLFSPRWPQVSACDQDGPPENGQKTSNAPRDCEPASR